MSRVSVESRRSGDGGPQALSVSQLNAKIKSLVEGTFPPIWVAGEVTDVAKPRSGHLYFTLKDDDAQIRAVIWRSTAERLRFDLKNGQAILCFGNLEVYSVRGTYQLVVQQARQQGIGTLQQAFEKLKRTLHAEGLFAAERKRALPAHPNRIAIVTSPSGAAIHDFLVAASGRMAGAEIIVIPAQVQGAGAAETIIRGLRAAAMIRPALDAVVVARGGGSLEDLWTFNEEAVVRAIANCPLPTVSAVGHEVDVTLADMAADVRALTPTDAASRVFSDRGSFEHRVQNLGRRIHLAMNRQIERRRQLLDALSRRPVLAKPMEMVHSRSRRLDELDLRSKRAIERQTETAKAHLARLAASLAALSPLETLARGYSVTLDESGKAITSAEQVESDQEIETVLKNGRVRSRVTEISADTGA